ncbi:MAG TPA: ATP-grasp domain-containing protein [Candidatus Obscuribacterales bacterium]
MNVVFLSPHFPPNFYHFCLRLKEAGANVLGLAEEHFHALRDELRRSLTEYYRVDNMHDYDQMLRALGYFTHRHGKIDRIDSQNEYWLELEAKLRTDFNIPGIRLEQINKIKRKSEMKRVFQEAGLKPARGRVCRTEGEIREFAKECGYPLVAKPDSGVGAARTYKIERQQELDQYINDPRDVDYIMEEFISAPIVTFDGLTDADGNIVFCSSLRYNKGVMEAVNENTDIYYYFAREIEPVLQSAGTTIVKAFDLRERFFHFEFFMDEGGAKVTPMEVNMRPPGGLTLDMFNFANDFDCYKIWADMLVHGTAMTYPPPAHHVLYVGRKHHIPYALTHEEVLTNFQGLLIHHEAISGVFTGAIGNYGYILRHRELPPLIEAAERIQQRSS